MRAQSSNRYRVTPSPVPGARDWGHTGLLLRRSAKRRCSFSPTSRASLSVTTSTYWFGYAVRALRGTALRRRLGQSAVTGSQPLERSAGAKAPSVPGDRRAGDRVEDAAEMVG